MDCREPDACLPAHEQRAAGGYHVPLIPQDCVHVTWVAFALLVVGFFLFIKIVAFAFRMAILVGILMLLYWLLAPYAGLPPITWS